MARETGGKRLRKVLARYNYCLFSDRQIVCLSVCQCVSCVSSVYFFFFFLDYKRELSGCFCDPFLLWCYSVTYMVKVAVMVNYDDNAKGNQWWMTYHGAGATWEDADLLLVHHGSFRFSELQRRHAGQRQKVPPPPRTKLVAKKSTNPIAAMKKAVTPKKTTVHVPVLGKNVKIPACTNLNADAFVQDAKNVASTSARFVRFQPAMDLKSCLNNTVSSKN